MLLTEKQRMAYQLSTQGLTDEEVADVMGIRREQANRHKNHARRVIRELRRVCACEDPVKAMLELNVAGIANRN